MTTPPPGPNPHVDDYHSDQPFLVPPTDAEKIISKCTYAPGLEACNWNAHPEKMNARVGRASLDDSNTFRKIIPSIGTLGTLPYDLIQNIILDHLTIDDVFRFRKTCVGAWNLLNKLPMYRVILTHAYRAYCTLIRTQAAPCVTLGEFYRLLCTEQCGLCKGEFGPYVYLPTWTRVCVVCKESNRSNLTSSQICDRQLATNLLRLSHRSRIHLRSFFEPVPHTSKRHASTRKCVFVSSAITQYLYDHALNERRSLLLDGAQPPANVLDRLFQDASRYDKVCRLPSYDPGTGQIRQSLKCAGCAFAMQGWGKNNVDYSGPSGHVFRQGNHEILNEWSKEGFLSHFKSCARAERLWEKSKGGKVNSWRILSNGVFESKWMQVPL